MPGTLSDENARRVGIDPTGLHDGGGGGGGGSFLSNQTARVDPSGSDATGTIGDLAKPFLTVQGAIDAFEALDPLLDYPIIDIGMNQYLFTTVTTSLPRIRFVGATDELGTSDYATYYSTVCRDLILTNETSCYVELCGCEVHTITSTAPGPTALLKVYLENAGVVDFPAITGEGVIQIGGNGYVRARVADVVVSNSGGAISISNVYVDIIDSAGSDIIAENGSLIRAIFSANNLTLKDSRVIGTASISGTKTYEDSMFKGMAIPGTPANASDDGRAGQVKWDANYIYICTAFNTWKRVAIATWP